MITIHDSRDIGCRVRAFVDDPKTAHHCASALGIPEECRIFQSEPRLTTEEAVRWALDGRQLRLDLDDERAEHEGTREALRDEEKRAEGMRETLNNMRKEMEETKTRNGQLAAELAKYTPPLPSVHTTEPAYADGVR
jgi:hypothetical protein